VSCWCRFAIGAYQEARITVEILIAGADLQSVPEGYKLLIEVFRLRQAFMWCFCELWLNKESRRCRQLSAKIKLISILFLSSSL